MDEPKLLLCDLDSTLAVKWEPELLPGRAAALARAGWPIAIVTNQGGVHAGFHWREEDPARGARYPTVDSLQSRLDAVTAALPQVRAVYLAFYVGHDEYALPASSDDVRVELDTGVPFHGSWSPGWRKPNGGMLCKACRDFGIDPREAWMLGDAEDDRNAAATLGVPFLPVDEEPWTEDFLRAQWERLQVRR
jgi:histidinol phosphatase-like enzyme